MIARTLETAPTVLCGACGAFIGPSSASELIASSSLSKILPTNDAPSLEHHKLVVDVVPRLDEEIEEIEEHINHTIPDSEERDQLDDHRNQLVEKRQACQSLLSCVRLFPSEILAEIFVLCLGRPISHHRDPINTHPSIMAKPPMSLAQVCSRWRDIVINDRRNWTHIQLWDVAPAVLDGALKLLKLWIQRSRGLPLSVHIPARHPRALFDVILGESHRWHQLSLHTSLLETIFLQKSPFPNLRVVHFLGPLVKGFKVMTEPPCLSDQDIVCCSQALPLHQITRLAIGADLGWLSDRFSCLIDLDLHCSTDIVQTLQNSHHPITFQRLETLHLGFVGKNADDLKSLSAALVVPKLHTLRISEKPPLMGRGDQAWDSGCSCRAICNLILRSSCSLKILNLYNAYMKDESAFLDCLKQTPELMKLEIGGRRPAPISDIFIALLSRHPTDAMCLLPSLKVLDIKVPLFADHEVRLSEIMDLRGLLGDIDGNTAFQMAQRFGFNRRVR